MCNCEWQDISTAPRDGTYILINCSPTSAASSWLASWRQDRNYKMGWVAHDCEGQTTLTRATHWKPLDAPKMKGE